MAQDLEPKRSVSGQELSPQATITALKCSREWLASWERDSPPPAAIVPSLKLAFAHVDGRCTPADVKDFLVAIDPIFDFARAWSIPVPDVAVATSFYRAALKDLPLDLLAKAVERTLAAHEGWSRLPLPAEIYRQVGQDYADRNTERYRLAFALKSVAHHALG